MSRLLGQRYRETDAAEADCVRYLAMDLNIVQYHRSVTECVQYLTLDFKKVQYHLTVEDCVHCTVPGTGFEESTVPPKCNRLCTLYSTWCWTWRKYSTTKVSQTVYTVQYLTLDLKKIQYHQSVTDCVHCTVPDAGLEEHTVPPKCNRLCTAPDTGLEESTVPPKCNSTWCQGSKK